MSSKITYLKWRNRVDEITPADHRIGDDLLLIDERDAASAEISSGQEPFKIDMTMAIIYEQGWADLRINMKDYHVQAPSVLSVMYDQIYQPISHSDDLKCKIILISKSFSDSLFINTAEQIPLHASVLKNPVMNMENEENVFNQFYQLLLNVAASPRQEYKLESARHLTLSMFYGYSSMKHEMVESRSSSTRQEEIYNDFLELLGKHYKQARETAFYADKLCITPKHLSQTVKDISGKTALDIIEDYVIAECKALLISTSMTIQQISDELNFPSQSVFGKYFKRVTGKSPKEYRKIH